MFIEIDYKQVKVPEEIIQWCDVFTYDAKRDDLRYIDCVYMNMGEYGNDLERLKRMREEMSILPVFD
tara:strand:- start:2599 stop:2799 length:201 start_codon:yes stop_codon:yes gene_type:complete